MDRDKPRSSDRKVIAGSIGQGKVHDSNSKSAKVHRKSPHSFTSVIELLLDKVSSFSPPVKDDSKAVVLQYVPSSTDMDIDVAMVKGKGKVIASLSEENEVSRAEASALLAKVVFILKLLIEIVLTYSLSANVLLRRDAEFSSWRGHHHGNTPGLCTGGIFHHILHQCSRALKKEKKVMLIGGLNWPIELANFWWLLLFVQLRQGERSSPWTVTLLPILLLHVMALDHQPVTCQHI